MINFEKVKEAYLITNASGNYIGGIYNGVYTPLGIGDAFALSSTDMHVIAEKIEGMRLHTFLKKKDYLDYLVKNMENIDSELDLAKG